MVKYLLIALLLAGCGADFEDPTIVIDLRVIGMRTEPAELVLDFDPMAPAAVALQLEDNPVTVNALVRDPAADRRLEWQMTVCPPTDTLRCDDLDAPSLVFGTGSIDDPDASGAEPSAQLFVPVTVLMESIRLDSLSGFGGVAVQLELRVWPEGGDKATESIFAAKKFVVAPRDPPERVANTNPTIESLLINSDPLMPFAPGRCGDAATVPLPVTREGEVILLPVEPDGVRETYVLPTFNGGVRTITENLKYAWFATDGSWSAEETGGPVDAFGNDPPLDSTWRAPSEPGEVSLWLVQRDERLGQTWTEYCVVVN